MLLMALGYWFAAWLLIVLLGSLALGLSQHVVDSSRRRALLFTAGLFGWLENIMYVVLIIALLHLGWTYYIAAL